MGDNDILLLLAAVSTNLLCADSGGEQSCHSPARILQHRGFNEALFVASQLKSRRASAAEMPAEYQQ